MTQPHRPQNHTQAGISLMELIAALTVIAAIVVGALALYNSASTTQRSTQIIQDVLSLRSATQLLYRSQGSYGAANTNLVPNLVASGKVPTTVFANAAGTALTSVFNAPITVLSTGPAFTIGVQNVPRGACMSIITSQADWNAVTVDGTAPTALPVTTDNAATLCTATTADNDILFTSN